MLGCTEPRALNHRSDATADDGTCLLLGCTNPNATNYDSAATLEDGLDDDLDVEEDPNLGVIAYDDELALALALEAQVFEPCLEGWESTWAQGASLAVRKNML